LFVQEPHEGASLESAALFLVFLDDGASSSFVDFYKLFVDLEDQWETDDKIVAPFHPDWEVVGDDPS
jgi:hypothetical protein